MRYDNQNQKLLKALRTKTSKAIKALKAKDNKGIKIKDLKTTLKTKKAKHPNQILWCRPNQKIKIQLKTKQ